MRIQPITTMQPQANMRENRINNTVSFKTYNPQRAARIEQELARKGIKGSFDGNDFVGECVQKTTEVFEKLFGK